MNNQHPLISVIDVHKSFVTNGHRVDVLRGVKLDIYEREMVAIVGTSGVGKSTLLHVMGTLERPDHGEVLYHGKSVFAYDEQRIASFRNQTIGFVFQFHHLLPEFNALENTMMPALIHGMNTEEALERAEAILTRVGLKDRFRHYVGELSGGEQQRVAVARSLVLKPSILLADEPTGNLDTKTGESIHDLLISLNRDDGITAVVVTHNMKLAEKLSRRVTLIDGKAMPMD
ncbi:MAG: ABC transporter ATP-binding protein [Deltaproteobacteria bacterium]|nr:ABC transporter ATP-binding protein [Deltaproteobacteria bacterium]MBW2019931.1 ABC transporter ATP-binding protein [Deltaproteobacteria bacterium]MBW2074558.1 ABC transporter ATP-binding protein [Deltaproteobacteria bacterium]RLB81248.1 MAG: lipoprotein-releasing system ATP-binding protein LolD [Deltaproteobacteria bacterium]